MAAYVIANIEVKDPEAYEEYKALAGNAVARYGGRFLARGGRAERLDGAWEPKRMVVLQFESFERAREWYASAEYAPAIEIRHRAAVSQLILVEGV